jgi:prepilin-type N-terminal cleavage/methylation domain-containing protein
MNNDSRFKPGFTLVEVMMSLIIFSLTMFFAIQFFKMIHSRELVKDDTAVQCAINAMEEAITEKDHTPFLKEMHDKWRIETRMFENDGLLKIEVDVYPVRGQSPVYRLSTWRIAE